MKSDEDLKQENSKDVWQTSRDFFYKLTANGQSFFAGTILMSTVYPRAVLTSLNLIDTAEAKPLQNETKAVLSGLRSMSKHIKPEELNSIRNFIKKPEITQEIQNNNLWSHLSSDLEPKFSDLDINQYFFQNSNTIDTNIKSDGINNNQSLKALEHQQDRAHDAEDVNPKKQNSNYQKEIQSNPNNDSNNMFKHKQNRRIKRIISDNINSIRRMDSEIAKERSIIRNDSREF